MYVLLYKFKLELYRYEYVNIYSYSSLPTQGKDLKEFPQCVAIKKNPWRALLVMLGSKQFSCFLYCFSEFLISFTTLFTTVLQRSTALLLDKLAPPNNIWAAHTSIVVLTHTCAHTLVHGKSNLILGVRCFAYFGFYEFPRICLKLAGYRIVEFNRRTCMCVCIYV